jgi:hypothetical protein
MFSLPVILLPSIGTDIAPGNDENSVNPLF